MARVHNAQISRDCSDADIEEAMQLFHRMVTFRPLVRSYYGVNIDAARSAQACPCTACEHRLTCASDQSIDCPDYTQYLAKGR